MKTYFFRDLILATFFVLTYFSIFIYGIIWLENGFKVDERIFKVKKDFYKEVEAQRVINMEIRRALEERAKINNIMPSAFKGRR